MVKTSPETYEKLVKLSELILERNNILEILGGFKHKKKGLSGKGMQVLVNEYLSKITLIDKQMSQVAIGLRCSVCQEFLTLPDEVLVCEWCGSPAHKNHLLNYVKLNGYCPACGEYLKYYRRGALKTVTHDLFKTCVVNIASKKIHELKIFYKDQLIESAPSHQRRQCPVCNNPVSPDWRFCRYCGTRLKPSETQEVQMRVCPRCGRQIKDTWRFCKMCGFPLHNLE